MIGFGEKSEDILRLIDDLAAVSCARLTIGQYQQPTLKHWPVAKYYHPDEFAEFKEIAYQKVFNTWNQARWCAVPITRRKQKR